MPEIIIDDDTAFDAPDGVGGATGLVRRPAEFKSAATRPFDLPLIPRGEWAERIRDMEASKSRLSDVILAGDGGRPIPSKDQNQPNTRPPKWGYCWAYATVGAAEAVRAVMGLPYVPLSAFAVAWTIKTGRDEGGWGALSLEFLMGRGVPSERQWPNFSASPRHDTAETWADAARHLVTEGWADLSAAVYDRDLTLDQKMTLLLCRVPVVEDQMWWSHCTYACDPLDFDPRLDLMDPNRWGSRNRNSWGDRYGDRGFFSVRGRRAIPDNAVAPRVVVPSPD